MTKKSGLGRGLGALLGDIPLDSVRGEDASAMREIPVESIDPNPHQPRTSFDEEDLTELSESIAIHGVLQPIVVRQAGTRYQIVAGERRYTAACRAGLHAISAVVREVSDEDLLKLALIENLQRSDLNPLEAARGYRALVEENGLTHEEVARVVSKSRSTISNALRLLDLPPEVQSYVEEGTITAGHARAILSIPDEAERIALARKVAVEGMSVRQTETCASKVSVKDGQTTQRRAVAPESYNRAAQRLGDVLGTTVHVKTVRGKNRVEIEFGNEEDLEALVARVIGA